jgi:hypothetical protein
MDECGSVSRRAAVTGFAAVGLLGLQRASGDEKRGAEEKTGEAHIFPYLLGSDDKLSDGGKKQFEIKEQTLLIWVDPLIRGKFPHRTEYVLISKSGARAEKGERWPVLNGHVLFDTRNNPAVISPIVVDEWLRRSDTALPVDERRYRRVTAHIWPSELKPGNKLTDGSRKDLALKEQTLLIWVEWPRGQAEYVLVSRSGTQIEKRQGRPVLNGHTLFRTPGHAAIVSPVVLAETGGESLFRVSDR